jgi:hypothetical protein
VRRQNATLIPVRHSRTREPYRSRSVSSSSPNAASWPCRPILRIRSYGTGQRLSAGASKPPRSSGRLRQRLRHDGQDGIGVAQRLLDGRGRRTGRRPSSPPHPSKAAAPTPTWRPSSASASLSAPPPGPGKTGCMRAGRRPPSCSASTAASASPTARRTVPLQRPFRLRLLPPAVRVQPARRPGAVRAAAGGVVTMVGDHRLARPSISASAGT